MKPDWKDAPEWAQWLAMDADGAWYWYEKHPTYVRPENEGFWRTEIGTQDAFAMHDSYDETPPVEERPIKNEVDPATALFMAAHTAVTNMEAVWEAQGQTDDWIYDEAGSLMAETFLGLREAVRRMARP